MNSSPSISRDAELSVVPLWIDGLRRRLGAGTVSAMSLSIFAVTSKALGLARELILAWTFGTSAVVDAFRLGLTYTTFSSHLFFGEAATGTVVPALGKVQNDERGTRRASELMAGVVLAAFATMIPLGIVFVFIPGAVLSLVTPDLSTEQHLVAASFLRTFGIGLPLYSLTAIAIMTRQAARSFAPLGVRPAGQNLFLMAGIIAASATATPGFIPLMFVVYYAILLAFLSPRQLVDNLTVGLRIALRSLRELATTWFPLALGLVLARSNILVERFFGSRLPTGSISALDYARTLTDLPLLVLAVPAGAVLLTRVNHVSDRATSGRLFRRLGALMLAATIWSVLVAVFARPLTTLVFARGAFDAASVDATSRAVVGLGVGAWSVVLSHLLIQYLMATSSRITIAAAGAMSLVANIVVAMVLVPQYGVLGLALASTSGPLTFGIVGTSLAWWQSRRAGRSR